MNRDFKGVWIPKEIWLNENLTLLEKIIFVEIDSLDNENHCIAGNEYFAKFCDCSESKVSKVIKKLKDLNMIEELEFDGRHRKIRVVKNAMQSSKKYEAESQNLQSNNIDNKQINNQSLSKDNDNYKKSTFQFGKQKEQKPDLYHSCIALIDTYDFSNNDNIRNLLIEYLNFRISIKDKPLYANMWKGMLNKLAELCDNDIQLYTLVIKQSIEKGYLSFYPVNSYSQNSKPWDDNVRTSKYTEKELEELDRLEHERESMGLRTKF